MQITELVYNVSLRFYKDLFGLVLLFCCRICNPLSSWTELLGIGPFNSQLLVCVEILQTRPQSRWLDSYCEQCPQQSPSWYANGIPSLNICEEMPGFNLEFGSSLPVAAKSPSNWDWRGRNTRRKAGKALKTEILNSCRDSYLCLSYISPMTLLPAIWVLLPHVACNRSRVYSTINPEEIERRLHCGSNLKAAVDVLAFCSLLMVTVSS